ncbi:MAG: hypothetical protein GWO86_01800 [Planctomycetes bacterium]|nr:hypothetical protein [Planctomycetota bacterium]
MLAILQTIIAASNNRQNNSWKQLLIIVAVVVVYGVKMLAGAKKAFTGDKEEAAGESPQPQPSRQQQGGQGGQGSEGESFFSESIPAMVPLKKIKPIEPAPEHKHTKIKLSTLHEPKRQGQRSICSELDLDLDDTDSLRRAIIYSEILGKPLALRQGG